MACAIRCSASASTSSASSSALSTDPGVTHSCWRWYTSRRSSPPRFSRRVAPRLSRLSRCCERSHWAFPRMCCIPSPRFSRAISNERMRCGVQKIGIAFSSSTIRFPCGSPIRSHSSSSTPTRRRYSSTATLAKNFSGWRSGISDRPMISPPSSALSPISEAISACHTSRGTRRRTAASSKSKSPPIPWSSRVVALASRWLWMSLTASAPQGRSGIQSNDSERWPRISGRP